MKTIALFFLVLLLNSCSTEQMIPREDLIGTWAPTYEIRQKDENGKWTDWQTINTYILIPSITFTDDGKLLWNGVPANGCCSFTTYDLNGNDITLGGLITCPNVKCGNCSDWKIIKLEENILELQFCEEKQERFRLAKD